MRFFSIWKFSAVTLAAASRHRRVSDITDPARRGSNRSPHDCSMPARAYRRSAEYLHLTGNHIQPFQRAVSEEAE